MEASWLKFPIPISNLYFLLFNLFLSVLHYLHIDSLYLMVECFALSGFQWWQELLLMPLKISWSYVTLPAFQWQRDKPASLGMMKQLHEPSSYSIRSFCRHQ
jgi:hypothetical protein